MKSSMNRITRRCLIALLLAALAGGIANAQEKLIPLKVALGDVDITKVPAIIALEEGIFRKNGLDVDLFITPGAASIIKASGVVVPSGYVRELNNRAPVAISGGTPLIVSRVTNAGQGDRIILASLDHIVHWHILARKGITKLEDLKGKRIGFSGYGAMSHLMLLEMCKRMKWDPVMDVTLMENGMSLEALEKDWVDAIILPGVAKVEGQAKGMEPIFDMRTWNVPIAGSGIQTTASWVKENRDTARRFVKSIVEAIAVLKNNKESAFRAMAKWYNISDREKQSANYQVAAEMPKKPYPAVDGITKTMELYDSLEMRKHKPEDFYDDSFIKELDQSGFIDSLYKQGK